MKYSDLIAQWLLDEGYTDVFFVAGGNIMHIIESFSKKFKMIPVMHEVSAVIAAESFNLTSLKGGKRALALVTVGPGITNTVSGIASAYIDGRDLLLIGGQVKSTDLKSTGDRQVGIQEVDGVTLMSSITKESRLLKKTLSRSEFLNSIRKSSVGHKGPVYLEICLDVQGITLTADEILELQDESRATEEIQTVKQNDIANLINLLNQSKRPLLLLGAGVPSHSSESISYLIEQLGIPTATTWGGMDRIPSTNIFYAGRPNTFGQRWANILLQQCDLLISFGSSLGLQQTGFNDAQFAPLAKIININIEECNFGKKYPDRIINFFCNLEQNFFPLLNAMIANRTKNQENAEWIRFKNYLQSQFPLVEESTYSKDGSINPFELINTLSKDSAGVRNIISCSSGGTYTSVMQTFEIQEHQIFVSSKGLGSMGVGLAGSVGMAMSNFENTWLFEGDGGFSQNFQELGVIRAQQIPVKVIIFNNDGYASIRATQQKYFQGNYVGCDSATGLFFPNYEKLASAFDLDYFRYDSSTLYATLLANLREPKPMIVEVFVSPKQEYIPKINSKLRTDGAMVSNPLHIMFPEIAEDIQEVAFKYLLEKGLEREP